MSLWPDPAFHRGLMLGGEDGRSLLVGSLPQLSMLPFIWIFSCGFSSFFTGGRGVTKQKQPVKARLGVGASLASAELLVSMKAAG